MSRSLRTFRGIGFHQLPPPDRIPDQIRIALFRRGDKRGSLVRLGDLSPPRGGVEGRWFLEIYVLHLVTPMALNTSAEDRQIGKAPCAFVSLPFNVLTSPT